MLMVASADWKIQVSQLLLLDSPGATPIGSATTQGVSSFSTRYICELDFARRCSSPVLPTRCSRATLRTN